MSAPYFNDGEPDAPEDRYGVDSLAVEAWRRRWPGYCPSCDGWGAGPGCYENHGIPGPGEYIGGDPCEELPEGTCHRCGHSGPGSNGELALQDDGRHPCPACGWNCGNNWDDGAPL